MGHFGHFSAKVMHLAKPKAKGEAEVKANNHHSAHTREVEEVSTPKRATTDILMRDPDGKEQYYSADAVSRVKSLQGISRGERTTMSARRHMTAFTGLTVL
eukprot:gnl/TRDRNA2_/TRDRNA2_93548_c0_seq1.p1 gnl/TRDRNA2_/TRDRNA2_93548_c0~~gnl/TRDRNA2_/TRDRNA2_93548_c0_seq1.p1  ORF type:complete len:101 (+),score=19.59 gnl/TRDRNA2_/TRDRNA2_93548_c0_seq1:56-358(+)